MNKCVQEFLKEQEEKLGESVLVAGMRANGKSDGEIEEFLRKVYQLNPEEINHMLKTSLKPPSILQESIVTDVLKVVKSTSVRPARLAGEDYLSRKGYNETAIQHIMDRVDRLMEVF